MVEAYDLWQALANMIWAFLGAFAGASLSYYSLGKYYGRQIAKGQQEQYQKYLKKEEEALNQRIKRSSF